MPNSIRITGTYVNFYFHCKRQLWFFANHINTEHDSDLVLQGRIVHENSFSRETKEIEIGDIKLDFMDVRAGVLHEVKRSASWSQAHEWQVLYYLYVLKQRGIKDITGEIHYPIQKETRTVYLTQAKEQELSSVLSDIKNITRQSTPPSGVMRKKVCGKCSYFELCWVD